MSEFRFPLRFKELLECEPGHDGQIEEINGWMLGYEDDGHLGATAFMKTRAYDHRFHLVYTNASPSSERRGEKDIVTAINTLIVDRKDQHIYGDESMSAIGKALASEYESSYVTYTGSAFQKEILDQVNCEISDFVHYELTEGSRWCPPSWGSGGTHVMGVNRSYSEGSIMPKRSDIKTISYQDGKYELPVCDDLGLLAKTGIRFHVMSFLEMVGTFIDYLHAPQDEIADWVHVLLERTSLEERDFFLDFVNQRDHYAAFANQSIREGKVTPITDYLLLARAETLIEDAGCSTMTFTIADHRCSITESVEKAINASDKEAALNDIQAIRRMRLGPNLFIEHLSVDGIERFRRERTGSGQDRFESDLIEPAVVTCQKDYRGLVSEEG